MDTVVIWDELDANIQFFVVPGRDLRYLNGKYVNSVESSDEECDVINDIVYTDEGVKKVQMTKVFPVDAVKDGAFVIVMGFLP